MGAKKAAINHAVQREIVQRAARTAAVESSPVNDDANLLDPAPCVDVLGREIVPTPTIKQRLEAFSEFTKLLSDSRNTRVAHVFALFSLVLCTVPVAVFMILFHVVLPQVGEIQTIHMPSFDEMGNLVAEDVAHHSVTLRGFDRSVVAGVAAISVALIIQVGYVIVALNEGHQQDPKRKHR